MLQARNASAQAEKVRLEEHTMTHYFTQEEAEALLPEISTVLELIREEHQAMLRSEGELAELRLQALGNGHHLHERITNAQKTLAVHIQELQGLLARLEEFGCELKDPEKGLIDFPSLRDGEEVYLCWYLGEEGIRYWHYPQSGFAGRQPL